MFPEITASAFSALVFGVVVVLGSQSHFTRTERQAAKERVCVLPDQLLHGRYRPSDNRCPSGNTSPACLMTAGAFVPHDWVMFFKCDEGYVSNTTQPITFCKDGRWVPSLPSCNRPSCVDSVDCPSHLPTCKNGTCVNVCAGVCGVNANCLVVNGNPICNCPDDMVGDPFDSCRLLETASCVGDTPCPSNIPSCVNGTCVNVCAGVCGVNANCIARKNIPVCNCPEGMVGDPFVSCHIFEAADLCSPDPCGENARCTLGYDHEGKEGPKCNCNEGYVGDPLTYCKRDRCINNEDCRSDQICTDTFCEPACLDYQCGEGVLCRPRNHLPDCYCPQGYTGDGRYKCHRIFTSNAQTTFNRK